VERSKREDLLFEVLEDDSAHAGPKLFPRLAVLRVVGEPAARGLELARVEDKLAARSRGKPGTAAVPLAEAGSRGTGVPPTFG
jgi:hypothetical protein